MRTATITSVEHAVCEFYILNDEPMSVDEIRQKLGLSDTVIRSVLRVSTVVEQTFKVKVILARSHSDQRVHQHRSVLAWHPCRSWMRTTIDNLQREKHYNQTERRWR